MKLSTRLMAAMVALVLLTAATIGLVTYRNIEAVALPRALARIDSHARILALELEASVRNARPDVLGFRSAAIDGIMQASLAGAGHHYDPAMVNQWRDRLAARFIAELAAKPNYSQYRVIGVADGGREVMRVDRSGPNGAIRIVPEAELQRKGDRAYFMRAVRLPAGEVDVSGVDLNEEQGAIELPHVPVIRAATPIYASDGRLYGIVIINVDLRSSFAHIRAAAQGGERLYVVNEDGDYLVHPDPNREFGAELDKPFRVQDEYPELAEAVARDESEPRVIRDRTGDEFGVGLESVRLAEGPRVTLINIVPSSEVVATTAAARDSTLRAGIAAVLGAIVLAILFTRSLTRPLVEMTQAVEAFAHDKPMAIPTKASGEFGVLARAFDRMATEVHDKTSALRDSEQAARHNAEILDKVIASMGDAVLVVDEMGSVLVANPAARRLFGDRPDIKSADWAKTYHRFLPDGQTPLPPEQSPIERARRGGEAVDNAEIVLRREGEPKSIHVLANGRPIRDPDGAIKGAVLVYRDVTEAKEIERQLRQAQKMDAIGQLTGGIAHDFNNILTVITGTIEILAEAVVADPQLSAVAKMIDEAAERGAGLTRHLLAFARKQPLQPRKTDINTLIVETAKLLRPALGEQIEIDSVFEDDTWPALVDPAQLTTALLNLAVNARDAMPDGGKLTIETGNVVLDEAYAKMHSEVRPGSYVMVAVSDTGAGIPTGIREKVFEPFFTTKDLGKGTGLGLSMVYGFVKQTGGHIKIYSEEGHGTCIKIYLPRSSEPAITSDQVPTAVPIQGGNETVLVVEDDALVRNHVIAQLNSLGYRTFAAASASDALTVIDREKDIDLLFTDVIMPGGMNGPQLAEGAKQRRPALKVLFTSGYTENAIVHHGRLDPGVLLLAKPYRKSDLARMIRIALASPKLI
jgi:PAS domain S-box-containing protein